MTGFVQIEGAAAVITGAGSGIGRASAQSLARRGARVVVTDVSGERAMAVASEIVAAGGIAVGMPVDVTNHADLEAARDRSLAEFGAVDIVMNNVGVLVMGPAEQIPVEMWQRVVDINILGIVRSNLVFLPLLIEQGHGHVVNTASVSGLLAHGHDRLPYVTTKHAVVGMSEALAIYLRPQGIGVTCLCPSGVRTNIAEQITFFGPPAAPKAPVAHTMVDAEEVGELVAGAIADGRFLVLTVPSVHDELVARTADIEAYIDLQSRE